MPIPLPRAGAATRLHYRMFAHAGREPSGWRGFLEWSATLHDIGEIQAIAATGMDGIAASRHSATRTNCTFRAVKTTGLIDCKNGVILDIHCWMKQPHATQIARQLLTRNLAQLSVLTADKGYDWKLLRNRLGSEGVKQVIKHREFGGRGVATNGLVDTTQPQVSNIESRSRPDENTARSF